MKQIPQGQSTAAATDVGEFLSDLDGGMFDRALSIALSEVAAKVVDNKKPGKVKVEFTFTPIPGTTQLECKHMLMYVKPTMDGKASEEQTRATVMHVGRYGALTLTQPKLSGIERQSEIPA